MPPSETSVGLAPGARLGPYEITAFIGAGGMGEVYRARDTRIGRDVAIKILPTSVSQDADRLARFEHEARAAGQLNHPNIVTLFDVGRDDGTPYVVSELLEGQTLRERLGGGALSARKAIDIAVPLARGLAAAHEKGIVHRDLKPENIFVTRDGQVKILDFGLAKLVAPEFAGGITAFPTAMHATAAGTVLGTVGYMSPEQVRGMPVDHRSDIFSFGAILYEMLSGRRAFSGDTAVETLNAILKEEPPDLALASAALPPAMDRIVRHCLEKNPEERFASARDVAFDLQSLSDVSGEQRPIRAGRLQWRRSTGLALLIALVGVGAFLIGQRRAITTDQPTFRLLTFRRGAVKSARFATDGRSVYYNAQWGDRWRVYMATLDSPEPSPIEPSGEVVGARPGEVALIVETGNQSTLMRVPVTGGAPREVASGIIAADWANDGTFAVVRESAGRQRLEFPPGHVLYQTPNRIALPRVSPSGHYLAFQEGIRGFLDSELIVIDSGGKTIVRSSGWDSGIFGVAWAPDESGVWVSGAKSVTASAIVLWQVGRDGTERLVYQGSDDFRVNDVVGTKMLVVAGRHRFEMAGRAAEQSVERDLTWLGHSSLTDISADGRFMLFEDGEFAYNRYFMFLGRTDGGAPVRLGEGTPGGLSPDGRWVLGFPITQPYLTTLSVVPTGAGDTRILPRGRIAKYLDAFWRRDGHTILIVGHEQDRPPRLFLQDMDQGDPRPITPEGVALEAPSLTSTGVLAGSVEQSARFRFYRYEGGEPLDIPGLREGDMPLRFDASERFLFVRDPSSTSDDRARIVSVDTRTGRREPWLDLRPADPVGLLRVLSVRLSADGHSYVYTSLRDVSNLFLVDGLQ